MKIVPGECDIKSLDYSMRYRRRAGPRAPTARKTCPEIVGRKKKTGLKRKHARENKQAREQATQSTAAAGASSSSRRSQQRKPELCAGMNMSVFAPGKACGLPLSAPCFNSTRCAPLPRPLMYVYDHSCSLANSTILAGETAQIANEKDRIDAIWRTAAANAGLLAETYESACLFVHVNLRADKAPCAPGAPLWNEGSNHVMVDLTDNSR